jgi:hypothetical protein
VRHLRDIAMLSVGTCLIGLTLGCGLVVIVNQPPPPGVSLLAAYCFLRYFWYRSTAPPQPEAISVCGARGCAACLGDEQFIDMDSCPLDGGWPLCINGKRSPESPSAPCDLDAVHSSSIPMMPSCMARATSLAFVVAGRPTAAYFARMRCRCVLIVPGAKCNRRPTISLFSV